MIGVKENIVTIYGCLSANDNGGKGKDMRQNKPMLWKTHYDPMLWKTGAAAVFYGAISSLQALLQELHDSGAEPPTPKLRATLEVLRATLDMACNHFHDYLESQYTVGNDT